MVTYATAKQAGTPTWLDLMTPNMDESKAFYRAVLGWEYNGGEPEFGGYTTATVAGQQAAGLMNLMPATPPMAAGWYLYFATDDIEADAARVEELGGKVVYPPMAVGTFGSMATCTDPTGATFSLWQANQHIGTGVAGEPGAAAWYELYTTNAAQARDFYAALLGASVSPMEGMEYYVLKHGSEELCGIMQIDPSWGEFPQQWGIYFAVPNTDAAVATATAHGGTLIGTVDDSPFGRLAALTDPHGAMFKIVQLPVPA